MLLRLAPMLAELGDGTGAVALLDEARQLHCPASEDTGTNLAGVLRFRQEAAGPTPGCLAVERLTERERTVLQLLQGTQSLGEVSEQLYISLNTLKSHVKTIYRKLGVSRRHDAVTKGRELGLIPQLW
jgi:LuxR family maltose regulon positive regulatory protein